MTRLTVGRVEGATFETVTAAGSICSDTRAVLISVPGGLIGPALLTTPATTRYSALQAVQDFL